MSAIYLLVPTLLAIIVSMLVVRAGAIALMMTGMSYEKAKFQALSAFSGTGFTTREAERVVNDARRRKIVTWLMVLGNAGIVTVIVATTSSFAQAKGFEIGWNLLILVVSIGLIFLISRHTPITRYWERFAQSRLAKLKTFDDDASINELLHLAEGYGVVRVRLQEDSPFIGKTISQINAELTNAFILGIEREQEWLPTRRLTRKVVADDFVVIYGKLEQLTERFG